MADSRQALFTAGSAGNIAPVLLKWWAQAEEGIKLPGSTWPAFFGWFTMTIAFALFSGYVAAFVWKERDTRRAFCIGLALPYILWGLLADVSGAVRPRGAHGQTHYRSGPGGVIEWRPNPALFPALKIEARAADTDAPINATTKVFTPDGSEPVAVSAFGTYALPSGKYRITASAPGYETTALEINHGMPQLVTIKLKRLAGWEEFLDGAKSYVWPPAPQKPRPAPPSSPMIQ